MMDNEPIDCVYCGEDMLPQVGYRDDGEVHVYAYKCPGCDAFETT